ncbi:4a-hydroxytetrahydrobiopterin dehydratase [Crateriforma conspicua]|uniref:Putative pterin-4-alpha-carbinolamine dehydratase n=1 Tax=Crateriforma conspicua TaxID=2527996 RepID=A0A5C5YCC3_9PLAN|nr:4a-hydroxytetrahydrobiopterin dehydratase [Crateriforma conspicua]TWT71995.1 putative pterin-4-alpha-carbinolamine dehydratase [Crateriforma conspicua]
MPDDDRPKPTPKSVLQKHCQPCEGGMPTLTGDELDALMPTIPRWSVSNDGGWIRRKFNFRNFVEAVGLMNEIAALAEREQHHPDLHLTGYRHMTVELTTHAIGGLSENDVILAAKIDQLADSPGQGSSDR